MKLSLSEFVKDCIVIDVLRVELLARRTEVVTQVETSSLDKHLPVAGICFVLDTILIETDHSVQNADLSIAVGRHAKSPFDFKFEHFGEFTFIPKKVGSGSKSRKVIATDDNRNPL